jgi:hypothetical protein
MVNVGDTTKDQIASIIQQSMDAGLDRGGIVKQIRALAEIHSGWRALRIARTETHGASVFAVDSAMEASGEKLDKIWTAAMMDTRTRATHRAANKQRVPRDKPFTVGGAKLMYPGDPKGPPGEVINCLVPDTCVSGRFIAGTRMKYVGPMFEITTVAGRRLSITPNHPVFTTSGCVPAKSLDNGFKLICYSNIINDSCVSGIKDNEDHVPSTIENVFHTIGSTGCLTKRKVSIDDFHGDANFGNGEINIVLSDRVLLPHIMTMFGEKITDDLFMRTAVCDSLIPGLGTLKFLGEGMLSSSCSIPGRTTLPFKSGTIRFQGKPLQTLGFGLASDFDPIIGENPVDPGTINSECDGQALATLPGDVSIYDKLFINDALSEMPCGNVISNRDIVFPKSCVDDGDAHSVLMSELCRGDSREISFDDVLNVREFFFDGHVYDLQSCYQMSIIIAQGIFISNCRYVLLYDMAKG